MTEKKKRWRRKKKMAENVSLFLRYISRQNIIARHFLFPYSYAVSALLHGLNAQLAAVLFSLGLASFAEHVLRSKLARIFDACILARACPGGQEPEEEEEKESDDGNRAGASRRRRRRCGHSHGPEVLWVRAVNLLFGSVAVFHLAYLGVGFGADGDEQSSGYSLSHVADKWGRLGYASHAIVLVFLGFSLLI